MRRRPFIAGLPLALAAARANAAATPVIATAPASDVAPPGVTHRALRFPADHGAHPDTHVEWWYVTGWLSTGAGQFDTLKPELGFQVTFFRTRTDLAATSTSRFAARQLVFAHVALTDLEVGARGGGLLHDQRAAREGLGIVQTPTASGEQVVRLLDWSMRREARPDPATEPNVSRESALRVEVRADRFALNLGLYGTQPIMLQGDAGYSQKGPDPRQASHYYSEPQLIVRGRVTRSGGREDQVMGRAWLDHEWSNEYLAPEALGWDWVGFNLLDGAALMAFRLRRADGSALWAGASYRDAMGKLSVFSAGEVRFEPLRRWTSPRTQVGYPVEWTLSTPAGRWRVVALQDDQELDSRDSTGSVYWEGISALHDDGGGIVGYGYLELTGYAGKLRL